MHYNMAREGLMNKKDESRILIHRLPLPGNRQSQTLVFELPQQAPVTAIVIGDVGKANAPLVRIHSRCLYGEVFGSLDCDCRAQLELALRLIKEEGTGVFIYLEQEGRGCGLVNKAKAYVLNEKEGLDTVDAYRKLGLDVDARLYSAAAEVLKYLGLKHVRLLTNNPSKVSSLVEAGIFVEQVYLRTKPTHHNIDYLRVKQFKLGHDLGLQGNERDVSNQKATHK